jgi:RES domain-containing protein
MVQMSLDRWNRRTGDPTVYRLGKAKYELMSPEGARRYGARWNLPGDGVIYTSATLSAAMLEVLSHTGRMRPPEDYEYVAIQLPAHQEITLVESRDLPSDWIDAQRVCQEIGTHWIRSEKTPILAVPSAVSPEPEYNLVLAPWARWEILRRAPLVWDKRLF